MRLLILMMIAGCCYSSEFFQPGVQTVFVRYNESIETSKLSNNVRDAKIATIRFNEYFKDGLSFGLEFNKYSFTSVPNRKQINGLGSAITVRTTRLVNDDWRRLHYNVDLGFGFIMTEGNFPESGTEFNFTEFIGMSFTYVFTDRIFGDLGLRYTHISNGGWVKGPERNPGADFLSAFFTIGYRY